MKLIFHLQEGKVEEFIVKKNSVSVGRGAICDVVLPYEGFSRRHAQIDLVEGEIFVTDLGSTNGVYIDGDRIPVSEKTAMQSFRNLQIGPAQQVEVLDDEVPTQSSLAIPRSEASRASIPRKAEQADQTKTTQMDPRLLRRPAKKNKDVSDGQNKMAMIVLPLLILGGAAFYFFNKSEELPPPQVEQAAEVPTVPLTEVSFLSKAMLSSLYKSKSCAADKALWCEDARILEANHEGVVVEGKSLVVYLNMTAAKDEKYAESFNSLDPKKRLEVLSIRRVFNSSLIRSFIRQSAFDNLQVVMGEMVNNEYTALEAYKFKRDLDMSRAEKFAIFELFDTVLNQGKTESFADISILYDKLNLE